MLKWKKFTKLCSFEGFVSHEICDNQLRLKGVPVTFLEASFFLTNDTNLDGALEQNQILK